MRRLYWRAGRLTAKNGGLRPGQFPALLALHAKVAAEPGIAAYLASDKRPTGYCPRPPGRSRALSVSRRKSILCGFFAWWRGALSSPQRRFPARAGGSDWLAGRGGKAWGQ
jgi:hypothetical protein